MADTPDETTGSSIAGVATAPQDGDAADLGNDGAPPPQFVRAAIDASDSEQLRRNPSNEDAKLDVGLDETFPGSDAPSNTQPGKGKDPPPSSGFDPAEEARIAAGR